MNDFVRAPTRELIWKSSLDVGWYPELQALERAMKNLYSTSHSYYEAIDFTAETWNDDTQLEAQDILREASRHEAILEVGCGRANILKSGRVNPKHYTGMDLSQDLIKTNRAMYPEAAFQCVQDMANIPGETGRFDYVFSHYVLEHCVFPSLFLDECVRVLRPGGLLCILCPDFLGTGRMSSQRAGYSAGTGRDKLSKGQYWDALVTGYDNKVRIPLYACRLRAEASHTPRFYINMAPTCFTDQFLPDVDAVYVAFADEIRGYLKNSIAWEPLAKSLDKYSLAHAHIYLKGRKRTQSDDGQHDTTPGT